MIRKPFETKRLILREPLESDAEELHPAFSSTEAMRWFGPQSPLSLQETKGWIENHRLDPEDSVPLAPWVAVQKSSNRVIGWGGLSPCLEEEFPLINELIYIIRPDYWRQGYGSELAQASLRYGFEEIGLMSIEATVHPQNTASIRLLEGLGLKRVRTNKEGWCFYRILEEGWYFYRILSHEYEAIVQRPDRTRLR